MLRALGHSLVLAYGRATPYHPGRRLLISRAVRLFGLRRPRETAATRRGVRFHFHLKDFLDVAIYYVGYHDYQETRLLEANMRPGDVFLDVGANIGYYTLLAARKAAPGGQVHAFEISRDEFQKLSENVNLNRFDCLIRLNRVAAADSIGEVSITPTLSAGMTRIDRSGGGAERVPALTVDQYVEDAQLSRVDWLKCDIEGAEMMMLRGATATLDRFQPVILIEINPAALKRFGASARDVAAELEGHDYALYVLRRGVFAPSLRLLADDDLPTSEEFINVVAVPRTRLGGSPERVGLKLPPVRPEPRAGRERG